MSEPTTPSYPPPPPAAGGANSNRTVMLVLSYLGLLALIPFLIEKDDREVQWHSKNGLVICAAEIVLSFIFLALVHLPFFGCLAALTVPFLMLAFLALAIFAIYKAVNGQRLLIPGLSDFADKF